MQTTRKCKVTKKPKNSVFTNAKNRTFEKHTCQKFNIVSFYIILPEVATN